MIKCNVYLTFLKGGRPSYWLWFKRLKITFLFPNTFSLCLQIHFYLKFCFNKYHIYMSTSDLLLQVREGCWWPRRLRRWRRDGEQLCGTVSKLHPTHPHTLRGRSRWCQRRDRGGGATSAELPAGQWLAGRSDAAGEGLAEGDWPEDRSAAGGTGSNGPECWDHNCTGVCVCVCRTNDECSRGPEVTMLN